MATSNFQTSQYTASQYVESAGAILFKPSTKQICLIHHQDRDEWLLPKGRRNVGETSQITALGEVVEETGYACQLLPITL
jgi:8-oxo-dGTP pyrophosphatase MutT (NUDIX family)